MGLESPAGAAPLEREGFPVKRNMELIRFLLSVLETATPQTPRTFYPNDIPDPIKPTGAELNEHLRLLVERGLARGEPTFSGWMLSGLTWAGHDFLDNSLDSKVWQAAKKAAGTLSFGVFTKVLSETATRYAMSRIETV